MATVWLFAWPVDKERQVVQLEPFDLKRARETGRLEQLWGAAWSGRADHQLPEGKLNLVGAPGRQRNRALFLALRVVNTPRQRAGGVIHAHLPLPPGHGHR